MASSSTVILSFTTALLTYALLPLPSFSGRLFNEFLYPNFTASRFQFIDNTGAFLSSRNGTFIATIVNPIAQNTNFYFSVRHVASNQIIWSGNRDSPVSISDQLTLTVKGITISDDNGNVKWSTPPLKSAVTALQLRETGNLVLLDQSNLSLWQSFDHPTDTIVIGQRFPIGASLFSSVSETDFSTGDYRFSVTDRDGLLQWNGLTYWRLSMDTSAFRDSTSPVGYMEMNSTGLYLFSGDGVGSVVVIQVSLTQSNFQIAKLDFGGRFRVSSLSGSDLVQQLSGPIDDCLIPLICGRIGLCSSSGICSCPSGFHNDPKSSQGSCIPTNSDYPSPSACNGNQPNSSSSKISFVELGPGIDYFANQFSNPVTYGDSLAACENLCTKNCSCLGIFYANSSGYCYLLNNQLGSVIFSTSSSDNRIGYIKTVISPKDNNVVDANGKQSRNFPIVALVLLPSTGFFLFVTLAVIGFIWWRRQKLAKMKVVKLGRDNSNSSTEFDVFSIPGLPVRFDYEMLRVATNDFETHIGSGGFGAVYKGVLPDKTMVAVKKINNLGVQGKKEFCTEIAVIGNIHHVNLVKLRGFCAQGRQRLLVYEYMNRGSLDRTLFGAGPVIEWQERVDIGLGTARGLAYLHSGCEQKIIHCDVKPENILLHDNFQVKISDFGLSKLLNPQQSSHFTTMRGTRGYLAPEWLTSSAISEKTDVYSYGMVLLEIVSGRKNCSMKTQSRSIEDDSSDSGGRSLSSSGSPRPVYFPQFALDMHEQGRYLELADPRLERRVTSEEVEKLVRVALCCVHEEPVLRPSMANVVGMLEGGIPLAEPRVEALNFLRFYGRRFTEASAIEGSNAGNAFMLYSQANASTTTTTTGSHNSLSYISSQQISGPR